MAPSCKAPVGKESSAHGELIEVRKVALPDSLAPTDAAISVKGDIVIWSQESGKATILDRRNGLHVLTVPRRWQPVGASFDADGSVDIWDAASSMLHRFSARGMLLSRRSVPRGYVNHAIRVNGIWFTSGYDKRRNLIVSYLAQSGELRKLYSVVKDTLKRDATYLGAAENELLLSSSEWPYETVRLALNGVVTSTFRPRLHEGGTEDQAVSELRALPLVSINDGFIQTFTDLRSDRRIVALLSEAGETRSVRHMEIPIGIAAADARSSTLVAVRNIEQLELVQYRWVPMQRPR
jgi:hypothetical protein